MEFRELIEIVGNEPLFETGLLLSGSVDPGDIRRQLSRWKAAGKIYQLRRGLYTLAPPYQKARPHPFLTANRLLAPSYVSLQSALAYYGMIPEYVPVTTSVTTRRPMSWQTPLGSFDFRHVQVDFFGGFHWVEVVGIQKAYLASPEKALLDLVYLQSEGDTSDYLRELRLGNLERLDLREMERLVEMLNKPKLVRALAEILKLVEEEKEFIEL